MRSPARVLGSFALSLTRAAAPRRVRLQLPHLRQSLSTARLGSIPAYLSAVTSIIPPRRRALIAGTTTLIFFFLLLRPNSSPRGPNPYHDILRGSGVVDAIVDRTTGLQRGANKAKMLEGFSNPYGFINLIDPCVSHFVSCRGRELIGCVQMRAASLTPPSSCSPTRSASAGGTCSWLEGQSGTK